MLGSHFGWKKDPYDKRDYLHTVKVPLRELPNKVILDRYLYNIRNQGDVSSCVGFSFAGNLNIWAKMSNVFTEWFSPTWIYNGARYLEGTLLFDIGCYPRSACKWLKDKGGLLERYWPYDPTKLDTKAPPSSLEEYSKQWPVLAYYRCVDGIEGICSAIADRYPVSIGTPWFYKWYSTDADGKLAQVKKTDSVTGGHATLIYGYDKNAGYLYGINSWGENWGRKGHFLMPFDAIEVFKELGGYDAYYLLINWSEIPPEPPQPVEKKHRIRFQYSRDGGTTWNNILDIGLW